MTWVVNEVVPRGAKKESSTLFVELIWSKKEKEFKKNDCHEKTDFQKYDHSKKKKKKLSIKKSQVKKNTIVIIKWLSKKRRLETNNKERLKNNI